MDNDTVDFDLSHLQIRSWSLFIRSTISDHVETVPESQNQNLFVSLQHLPRGWLVRSNGMVLHTLESTSGGSLEFTSDYRLLTIVPIYWRDYILIIHYLYSQYTGEWTSIDLPAILGWTTWVQGWTDPWSFQLRSLSWAGLKDTSLEAPVAGGWSWEGQDPDWIHTDL